MFAYKLDWWLVFVIALLLRLQTKSWGGHHMSLAFKVLFFFLLFFSVINFCNISTDPTMFSIIMTLDRQGQR